MRKVLLLLVLAGVGCGPPPAPPPPPKAAPPPSARPPSIDPGEWEFLTAVHARIRPRWEHFLAAIHLGSVPWMKNEKLEAFVALAIDPLGRPAGVWLAQGSGTPQFDLRATEVVLESAPFPTPPASMRSDDGYAHLVWRFKRGPGSCDPLGATVVRERYALSRVLPLLAAERRLEDARIRIGEALTKGEAGPEVVRAFARALLWAYLHDPDRDLRHIAALSLGLTGDPEAHEALRQMLTSEAAEAVKAVRALGRIGDREDAARIVAAVQRNDGVVSLEAAPVAVRLGLGAEVVEKLTPALTGTDPLARGRALRALGAVNEARALPVLIQVATDKEIERDARVRAIDALGRLRAEEAARVLAKLGADADSAVRAAALVGLGRTGRLRAKTRTLVIERLRDPAPQVRAAAAATLIRVATGPGEWRGPVREVLRSNDLVAGLGAVDSLVKVGGTDAVRTLASLAEKGRKEVRAAAIEALRQLAPDVLPPELKERAAPGKAAALQATTDRDALLAGLADRDLGIACVAAQRLAATGADLTAARALVDRMTRGGSPTAIATLASAYLAGARFECPSAQVPETAAP